MVCDGAIETGEKWRGVGVGLSRTPGFPEGQLLRSRLNAYELEQKLRKSRVKHPKVSGVKLVKSGYSKEAWTLTGYGAGRFLCKKHGKLEKLRIII